MTEIKLKQLVAFCILMQDGEGIIDNAPSYIEEKYESCIHTKNWHSEEILDSTNQAKFKEYCEKWISEKEVK